MPTQHVARAVSDDVAEAVRARAGGVCAFTGADLGIGDEAEVDHNVELEVLDDIAVYALRGASSAVSARAAEWLTTVAKSPTNLC